MLAAPRLVPLGPSLWPPCVLAGLGIELFDTPWFTATQREVDGLALVAETAATSGSDSAETTAGA